jgi:hypothetical protein
MSKDLPRTQKALTLTLSQGERGLRREKQSERGTSKGKAEERGPRKQKWDSRINDNSTGLERTTTNSVMFAERTTFYLAATECAAGDIGDRP